MGRAWSSSVVVWLSSSEVVVVATTDTTTDNNTDGNPLLPSAIKADPCVLILPKASPECVLGRDRPGWARVGRGRRWGVVADGGLHSLRRRLRGVGVGGGGGCHAQGPFFSTERKKLFECVLDARTADSTGCARVKTAHKKLFPFTKKRDLEQNTTKNPHPL